MAEAYKFVREEDSQAFGAEAYQLKLDPIVGSELGGMAVMRLVRLYRAQADRHVMAVEPGRVDGLPGVRAIKLWPAMAPDKPPYDGTLSLDEAAERPFYPPQIFLASASTSGTLVVSSCLGMAYDSPHVMVASPIQVGRELLDGPSVHMSDYGYGTAVETLVEHHLSQLNVRAIDPDLQADVTLDVQLIGMLQTAPESVTPVR